MRIKLYRYLIPLVSLFSLANAPAQVALETFGQNRLQSRQFDWNYYEAKRFKIYHYERSGRELARYVAEQAEQDISAVENKLGGIFADKLNIVLYNCYDHFQQTNIGLNAANNIQNNNAGTVNIVGDKIVIYYTGKHSELKRQLRAGISAVILEKIMFGDNIGEALKNAVVLNLPQWFTKGYLDYVVDGWTTEADNEWKTLVNTDSRVRFENLAMKFPEISGRAFWKYLTERYGDSEVKNFIYLSQNGSDINRAIQKVTGHKIVPIFDSLVAFYRDIYNKDAAAQSNVKDETALIKIDNNDWETRISNVKVSPRGFDVAYVAWKNAQYRVKLETTKTIDGVTKKNIATLVSGGVLNHNEADDPNYPLLAWNNTGYKLGIIYKKYNTIYLKVYDALKAKIDVFNIGTKKFDRILGFSFMEDDDMIVLSAIKNGQSDIFEYRMKRGRVNQITNDPYDDLEPNFVSGGARKGVAFLSNRPEPYINIKPLPNEIPAGKMKGYFYNYTTKSYDLLPLTPNEKGQVTQIIPYGPDYFSFLTNENGVSNRNVVLFGRDANNKDTAYSLPVTNGNYGILYHQYNPASKSIADVVKTAEGINVYFRPINLPEPYGDLKPQERQYATLPDGINPNKMKGGNPLITQDLLDDKGKPVPQQAEAPIVRTGTVFQSVFSNRIRNKNNNETDLGSDSASVPAGADSRNFANKIDLQDPNSRADYSTTDGKPDYINGKRVVYVDSTYIKMRSYKYRRAFIKDFYSARLDNSYLFTRYQSFNGLLSTPDLGGMLSVSLFDKMEDYRFFGSFRLPFSGNGSAYIFQFENFKRAVDWGVTYFREAKKTNVMLTVFTPLGREQFVYPLKQSIQMLTGYATYPINRTNSIRLSAGLRQDRAVIKSVDSISVVIPKEDKYYITSRAEYVYDDTKSLLPNIPEGFKFKIYGEYLYKFYNDNVFTNPSSSSSSKGGFYNAGFDFRHYTRLYKHMIFAVRAAAAHSGGNEKILYIMGGVDNALNAKFASYPLGSSMYAFQSMATNLRGYDINARNGNTYGLVNAELRVPVFETLFRKPVQASIWKNLQAIAFVDFGSAWEGLLPSERDLDSRRSTFTAPGNPNSPGTISVTVPFLDDGNAGLGYGAGLRTMIYGYFLRGDAAWNRSGQFRFHLSMGFDF